MTNGNMFVEREESLSNLWLFIVINTTVLALLINILSLHYGNNDVAPNLFYIPVVIAAYWYPHRGPVFAVIISLAYMAMVYVFMGAVVSILIPSSIICYVLIGVSVVVSSLATHMRKNELKYRGLFNHSQAGVGLVNLATQKIQEANHHFSAMLGYSEDEILRRPVWRPLHGCRQEGTLLPAAETDRQHRELRGPVPVEGRGEQVDADLRGDAPGQPVRDQYH